MYIIALIVGISLIALMLNFYMWKREALRREAEHERRMERLSRLLEQLQDPDHAV